MAQNKCIINQVIKGGRLEKPLSGKALIDYKKTLVLNQHQKDIIIGTLLGHSSFGSKNGQRPVYCIKFQQKATQADYVHHLYAIFKPFVGTGPKLRTFTNSYHVNKPGERCWFRTYSHVSLKYYENLFYIQDQEKKRVKRVPKNIHKLLTPRALAYWFMDDGSSAWSKPTNRLCCHILNTQGFSLSDQKILVLALKRNFNLNVTIHKDKTYDRLGIGVNYITHFQDLIRTYVHADFFYKLELYKLEPKKLER